MFLCKVTEVFLNYMDFLFKLFFFFQEVVKVCARAANKRADWEEAQRLARIAGEGERLVVVVVYANSEEGNHKLL